MEHLSLSTAPEQCALATSQWNSAPVDLEVVKALREMMGEAFSEAVAAFLEDTESRLMRIRETLQARDAQALWQLAHAIKGTSSNVGAVGLSAMAEAIENFCKADRLANVLPYLDSLEGLYEHTCAILQHAVQEQAQ